jgi:trk system potassium uptake protein TrkH
MVNFRVIARVFSQVLIFEGLIMLLSAAVSFLYQEPAAIKLLFSAIITVVTGILVFTPLRNEERLSGYKEGYIIITGLWIICSLFGTLPFILSGSIKNFGDAFFESISGFTTTGATILTDIESLPYGVLFWRSMTQWLGGLGFILISLSLIPVVKSLNVQLTMTDFTGQTTDKINPRVSGSAKRMISIYTILTMAEAILLIISGMPLFDSVCHSLTTMSTGGFSTRDHSISSFGSPPVLIITTVFMFTAGTNMTLFYHVVKRNYKKAFGNHEFIFYTVLCLAFILIVSTALAFKPGFSAGKGFLEGTFQTISIITTTGFYNSDYSQWGSFLIFILFILMFTGGTSGSPGSSIKIGRILLIAKNIRHEMRRMIHPNASIPVRLDKKVVADSMIHNILVFLILYLFLICLSSIVISFMGYDIITAFSTSAAMLGNIGPAFGTFGPFSNYAAAPIIGKWFFAFLMLLGRLELLSVLVFFTRGFYRR